MDRPESNVLLSLLAMVLVLILGLCSIGSVSAQAEGDSPTEVGSDLRLATKAENPVSDIIRVPIVNATLFGIGPNNQVGNALLIAPIVPVHLVTLGFKGWLKPQAWPAYLPSISLIAFVAALVPLVVKRRLIYQRKKGREDGKP